MSKIGIFVVFIFWFVAVIAEGDLHESIANDATSRMNPDAGRNTPEREKDASFWRTKAQNRLGQLIKTKPLKLKAKNIILLIGDGMSIPTITASRIFKAQARGSTEGEEETLRFETLPYSGLSKTYCTNAQVGESACTGTALLSGTKTNMFTLGVTARVEFNNCAASKNKANQVETLATWAQKAGKSTGIVTTTSVTDATPAAVFAHSSNRFLESDSDMLSWNLDPATCEDIASQLVRNSPGKDFNVILGGGRSNFLPKTVEDEEGRKGNRLNGNLIREWEASHPKGKYVRNSNQLKNIDPKTTTHVLGLFKSNKFAYSSNAAAGEQPTLSEMTESAIKMMQPNPKGFFLMVEGGLIDGAHHATRARQALEETIEFDKAVETALRLTNPKDTLIVVTADHSHTMSIGGYPRRGNNILGIDELGLGSDLEPYTVLSYANGPNQYLDKKGKRVDISQSIDPRFPYPSYVPMDLETHGGDDVAVYASGPYAHYFSGAYEQNNIAHFMAFASCIGDGRTHCKKKG